MASLPSYQEAVSSDWLHLVVPYASPRDYPSLCRVSRRFWDCFAPRLWGDILRSCRQTAGVESEDALAWWFNFVFRHLRRARPATRDLARVFDARDFPRSSYSFDLGRNPNRGLLEAVRLLPNLGLFLIDGHQDLDPAEFLREVGRQVHLLSMADSPLPLPARFVTYDCLRGLVYLDISGVPGSIRPLLKRELLPDLRVLKIRNKEVDDAALEALASQFETRLWSLDLAGNKLTDHAVDILGSRCLWPADLHSDAYFDVEGKLESTRGATPDFASWIRLVESPWSGSFSHPGRHHVDAPSYTDRHDALPQEYEQQRRLDGRSPAKSDSADAVCRGLQGEDPYFAATSFQSSRGLTHLNLSDNQISSLGIQKLLTLSRGHLEQFTCDSMPVAVPPPSRGASQAWPRTARLHGFFAAYALRPVFSSNLRVVRLHHSAVTQIPTLEIDGLSTMARMYIAETSILPRAEGAFSSQAFVPDMNPRVTSLTLTRIPRRSRGPLISKLINFLKLLSEQERSVFDASSRRGPGMLSGLRHLRLEFEPDPCEEGFSLAEDLDAEELMRSGDKGFSFFDENPQPTPVSAVSGIVQAPNSNMPEEVEDSVRREPEYLGADITMDGKPAREEVWVGSKESRNPVIEEYRRLVLNHHVRDHIGPATPPQILAGAPPSALVFHTAWSMAVMPPRIKAPTRTEMDEMRDVLVELKQFRLGGRAKHAQLEKEFGSRRVPPGEPHGFWTGRLEVSTLEAMPQSRSTQYWR
ncbi:hypothetical protein ACJ41O_014065 [Fusarium nematophilum]